MLYVVSSPLVFTILTVFNLSSFYCVVKYTPHSIVTVVNEELASVPCLMSISIPLNSFMSEMNMCSPTWFRLFIECYTFLHSFTFDLCVFVCKADFSLNKINKKLKQIVDNK